MEEDDSGCDDTVGRWGVALVLVFVARSGTATAALTTVDEVAGRNAWKDAGFEARKMGDVEVDCWVMPALSMEREIVVVFEVLLKR